jgi:amino acid transporter
MELSKLQREVIGRAALAAIGLMLLYGGYRCMAFASAVGEQLQDQNHDLPYIVGAALLLGGVLMMLAAVLPTGTFARAFGRAPKNVGLGEGHSWEDWKR